MKCQKHPVDISSDVGVCASCLRQRLSAIVAEKEAQEARRNFDNQPPPLAFPRSVSPYLSCRKSDAASSTTVEVKSNRSNGGRLSSLFSGLFRSKTDPISDPGVAGNSRGLNPNDSCTSSPSKFPAILPDRPKKQSRALSLDKNTIEGHRRTCGNRDRGMSPARLSADEDENRFHAGHSGYSSESSQGWKQTPRRTPAMRRRGVFPGTCRNVSGISFCLSPLVRASPNLHWNQKGLSTDAAFAGESRIPARPYPSNASSFCKNRSRKLCDLGRYNLNH